MYFPDPFFEEGKTDFYDGYERYDCPYEEGTDGEYGWLTGWDAAALQSRRVPNWLVD